MPYKDPKKKLENAKRYREAKTPEQREADNLYFKRRRENFTAEERAEDLKKRKNYHLKTRYGITLEEYEQMAKQQKEVCLICGQKELKRNRKLSVDHCHETGEIRGLLCYTCNTTLARLGDNLEGAMRFVNYLKS
jgi:hypothetical protein